MARNALVVCEVLVPKSRRFATNRKNAVRFWFAVTLATSVAPAFAADSEELPPRVPPEVMSIQRTIPVVPQNVPVSSYPTPANVNASSAVLGTVSGTSVSGIGNAVPVTTVPTPGSNLINSTLAPRVR
jgi:hypothetical protein